MLMTAGRSVLLIIDIQEKLAPACVGAEALIARTAFLLKCAARLEVPVLISEQYPRGLGGTVAALKQVVPDDVRFFAKTSFSCVGEPKCLDLLQDNAYRDQIVVAGIETHVCVLQTVLDLLGHDKSVFVVADAVGSRTSGNTELGLARMARAGAQMVTSESVMFEWLRVAGTAEFKDLSALIK